MNNKQESILSGVAGVLLLLTAMLDPRVSVTLAVVMLIAFSLYKFSLSKKPSKRSQKH